MAARKGWRRGFARDPAAASGRRARASLGMGHEHHVVRGSGEWNCQPTRARPQCRAQRNLSSVVIHAKICSTRRRWLPRYGSVQAKASGTQLRRWPRERAMWVRSPSRSGAARAAAHRSLGRSPRRLPFRASAARSGWRPPKVRVYRD